MNIKIYCDKCNKELTPPISELTKIEEDPQFYFPNHYYLCNACTIKFREWLKLLKEDKK